MSGINQSEMLVGLDIGTTKVCAIIGEMGQNGELTITGVGSAPSRGMRKGVVVNIDSTVKSISSAIEEAEAGVERTARSTLIREQHDFRASVNTVDCESVTRVSFAATADPVREHFKLEDIHPGDVFIFNDPYQSHGTLSQLPDLSVAVPVFAEGRLLAFAQIFGHLSDVGGRVSGSLPLTSTTIFEEGIQVPPVKLYERGILNTSLRKLILRNSKFVK